MLLYQHSPLFLEKGAQEHLLGSKLTSVKNDTGFGYGIKAKRQIRGQEEVQGHLACKWGYFGKTCPGVECATDQLRLLRRNNLKIGDPLW